MRHLNAAPAPRWFIYYRVAQADLPAVVHQVRQFQQRLPAGLQCGLLRRPGEPEGSVTLMETYAFDADTAPLFDPAAIEQQIEAAARDIAPWLLGGRHVETFVPVD